MIKRLIDKQTDFANKRFEGRIDCYKLCPGVDENANFREMRPDWRTSCQ